MPGTFAPVENAVPGATFPLFPDWAAEMNASIVSSGTPFSLSWDRTAAVALSGTPLLPAPGSAGLSAHATPARGTDTTAAAAAVNKNFLNIENSPCR